MDIIDHLIDLSEKKQLNSFFLMKLGAELEEYNITKESLKSNEIDIIKHTIMLIRLSDSALQNKVENRLFDYIIRLIDLNDFSFYYYYSMLSSLNVDKKVIIHRNGGGSIEHIPASEDVFGLDKNSLDKLIKIILRKFPKINVNIFGEGQYFRIKTIQHHSSLIAHYLSVFKDINEFCSLKDNLSDTIYLINNTTKRIAHLNAEIFCYKYFKENSIYEEEIGISRDKKFSVFLKRESLVSYCSFLFQLFYTLDMQNNFVYKIEGGSAFNIGKYHRKSFDLVNKNEMYLSDELFRRKGFDGIISFTELLDFYQVQRMYQVFSLAQNTANINISHIQHESKYKSKISEIMYSIAGNEILLDCDPIIPNLFATIVLKKAHNAEIEQFEIELNQKQGVTLSKNLDLNDKITVRLYIKENILILLDTKSEVVTEEVTVSTRNALMVRSMLMKFNITIPIDRSRRIVQLIDEQDPSLEIEEYFQTLASAWDSTQFNKRMKLLQLLTINIESFFVQLGNQVKIKFTKTSMIRFLHPGDLIPDIGGTDNSIEIISNMFDKIKTSRKEKLNLSQGMTSESLIAFESNTCQIKFKKLLHYPVFKTLLGTIIEVSPLELPFVMTSFLRNAAAHIKDYLVFIVMNQYYFTESIHHIISVYVWVVHQFLVKFPHLA